MMDQSTDAGRGVRVPDPFIDREDDTIKGRDGDGTSYMWNGDLNCCRGLPKSALYSADITQCESSLIST